MAESITPHSLADRFHFPERQRLQLRYDQTLDTLFISADAALPAVSVDVEGEFWIRFVPERAEVVGVEIEDFRASFLPQHDDIAREWARSPSPRPVALWDFLHPESFQSHLMPVLEKWQREASPPRTTS